MLAPTESDLPATGDTIASKYRVEQILGRGGMGAVFRVTHSVTGKSFAVKWLLQPLGAGPEIAQRFIREAQVAGRVDHPNIVEVYDIGEDRGSMYMVMELLQGESLAQHLSQVGRLPPSRACQLLIPVTRGLAAAHKSGVIHRDLKPDNIFLSVSTTGDQRPKILDFGISKMSALATDVSPALTREGVVMGTPHYMAPEQLRSNKVDERCDVYALGVILYQMISGKLPFVGDNFPDLMLKIVSETPVPLAKLASETPPDLIAIIERAMARSPEERFGTVAELGRALERFGEGALFDSEPTLSTRPPSSILPVAATPATPVAMESRFPVTASQRVDLLQRARRFAVPIAASAISAALLSWTFVSMSGSEARTPSDAASMRLTPPAAKAVEVPKAAAVAVHPADERLQQDDLPTPSIETLPSAQPYSMLGGMLAAPRPAAIEPFAPSAGEPVKSALDLLAPAKAQAEQPASKSEPATRALSPRAAASERANPALTLRAEQPASASEPKSGANKLPPSAATQPAAAKLPAPSAPGPVPPPGSGEADPSKSKPKKTAAAKPSVKVYNSPEIRIDDFYK